MLFPLGTKMYWKGSGLPAYEKADGDEWGWWRSLEYNLDKPLNERWGWKWTDTQVFDYYNGIMNFKNS